MAKDHFIISEKCAPEQRKLFEAINAALDNLGMTATEFDRAYRIELMQQCSTLPGTADSAYTHAMGENNKIIKQAEPYKMLMRWQADANQILLGQNLEITSKLGNTTLGEFTDMKGQIQAAEPRIMNDVTLLLNQEVGHFQDIDVSQLSPVQMEAFKRFNAVATYSNQSSGHGSANLLQEYADGKPLLNDRGEYHAWTVKDVTFETLALGGHIRNALARATLHAPGKQIGEHLALTDTQEYADIIDCANYMMGHKIPLLASKPIAPPAADISTPVLTSNRRTDRIEARKQRKLEAKIQVPALPPTPVKQEAPPKRAPEVEDKPAVFTIAPFTFGGIAQSLIDRGNPARALPGKSNERSATLRLQDVVREEILPVKAALNKNFEPHNTLGNALFADKNYEIVRVVDYISTDARVILNDKAKPGAAEAIKQVFSLELQDTPEHNVNKDGHKKLAAALALSPILIVAALGTGPMITEMKGIQQKLFPERNKDRPNDVTKAKLQAQKFALAAKALQDMGIDVPPALMKKINEAPAEHQETQPKDMLSAEFHKAQMERWLSECRRRLGPANGSQESPLQFRCQLQLGQDMAINYEVCDMEGHHWQKLRVPTNAPYMGIAEDIKKAVQSHVLHSPGIYPYREMRAGVTGVYGRRTDAAFNPASIASEKAKGQYKTSRIVKAFDKAIQQAMGQEPECANLAGPMPGSGGGGPRHGILVAQRHNLPNSDWTSRVEWPSGGISPKIS